MEQVQINDETLQILQMYEARILEATLKDFKFLIDTSSLSELEDIVKQDVTEHTPSIIDGLQILMKSNYDRDELLREAHIVGQQYADLQDELKYYKELMNEQNDE